MPVGDLLDAPDWFNEPQKAMWTYAIANAPPGLLKRLDRDLMIAWCVACDLHRQATEKQSKLGLLTRTPDGNFLQSPYLPIINRQATIMKAIAVELGFSPTSRARIELSDDTPKDAASKYID